MAHNSSYLIFAKTMVFTVVFPSSDDTRVNTPVSRSNEEGYEEQESAVEHRPTDGVPQPLVIEYKIANRLWEMFTLPLALLIASLLALTLRCGSACGLDCIGSGAEFVRGDVCDDRSLASSICCMAWCPS
jgi:hypothetical protein